MFTHRNIQTTFGQNMKIMNIKINKRQALIFIIGKIAKKDYSTYVVRTIYGFYVTLKFKILIPVQNLINILTTLFSHRIDKLDLED